MAQTRNVLSRHYVHGLRTLTFLWHSSLRMPKYSRKWHVDDIRDEISEYRELDSSARTFHSSVSASARPVTLMHVSELSDVLYTVSRAHWTGHDISNPPRN